MVPQSGQLVSFLHFSRLTSDFALPFSPCSVSVSGSLVLSQLVSGEGEVILAQLFLMLIVLHCVQRVILTNSTFLQCQEVGALIAFLEAASMS